MSESLTKGPIVLTILDGWGIAPESRANPIFQTELSNFDKISSESIKTRLWAHGQYVGLLKYQDGNSEAGHLNIGAGRVVKQDSVFVTDSIKDGTFFKNSAFQEAIGHVKRNNSNMHIMGMLSDGQSAHSTPDHLYALLDLMEKQKVEKVFLHLFSDGRDSSPKLGKKICASILRKLRPNQKIATITGRFYAMDRKKEWSRTEAAYNAMVLGEGVFYEDPVSVFDASYKEGLSDEFVKPSVICKNGKPVGTIKDNDSIIFFNHRSDRARQITKPFVQKDFIGKNSHVFKPKEFIKNLRFVAMTDFGPDLEGILTAYPSIETSETLPMVLSNKKQVYIAETEKYAHITYFFNGGYADTVAGEERILIPSPSVDRYDKTPSMATRELAEETKNALDKGYDFIALNIACTDMVAHTGNFEASKEALRATDQALLVISEAVKEKNGILIVTSDHGNIEEMIDLSTGEIDTEHSKNQVPFWIWSSYLNNIKLREEGILADIAPTILDLFGILQPKEMTGKSLIKKV